MIPLLLIAAAVRAAPAPTSAPAPALAQPSAHELLVGAEQALQAERLDQATIMISRAMAAGASGAELDRALADLAYASGKYAEALARYQALLKLAPSDRSLLEPAGIAALKLGDVEHASPLLQRATAGNGGSWRAWNALGAIADMKKDWPAADQCYDQAERRAPSEAAPINNRGWSLLLRGQWQEARSYFERAAVMKPSSKRIADNLELANVALSADLPRRRAGESDRAWAERLNDAGVAAEILGDKQRAIAAFTQALDASGTWYERAANNLEAAKQQ
jgi:Flp pilus assembly protein TadD